MLNLFARLSALLLVSACVSAQVGPIVATTVKTTDVTATSICVGCPLGSTTPAANGGVTTATVVLKDATPSVTTNKIYNVGGALFFNGLSLATGSSIAGTVGTVPKFTAATTLGDSNATISGSNWTITGTLTATSFIGSGASLTSIPTSAVSSGNFVATVASGTGITSSVTSGNAAATTIKINDTAVTPSTYGSSTAISQFTVDQQGRLTSATTVTPQLTLTSTYFSSLSGANLTGVALLAAANVFTVAGVNTFGAGGTGTDAGGQVVLNGPSGSSAGARLDFKRNSVAKGYVGNNSAIAGGTSDDVTLYTTGALALRFYTNDLYRWGINPAGDLTFGTSSHIADSNGTPSISSGFGTSPAIAGTDYAFEVGAGTGLASTGTVNFGHTFTNRPICTVASFSTPVVTGINIASSPTQLIINYTAATSADFFVLCRSY